LCLGTSPEWNRPRNRHRRFRFGGSQRQGAALELNTNLARTVQSNESGTFTFTNLPPGSYNISVELTGFRKSIRDRVDVAINSTTRVDFQLQPGQVSEQIEVTATLPALQTDRTDTGRSMDQRQVSELPLTQDRNFQGLVNLVPGAARAQRNHSEFFNSNDSMQSRVNGQSRMANNVQFEGLDNNHRTGLLTALHSSGGSDSDRRRHDVEL